MLTVSEYHLTMTDCESRTSSTVSGLGSGSFINITAAYAYIYYKYLVSRSCGNQLKENEISRNRAASCDPSVGSQREHKWEEGTEKRMEIEQLSPS